MMNDRKRIGILTMPQKTNYGGLLQAYALQTVLVRLGCDVEILQREYATKVLSCAEKVKSLLLPIAYKIQNKNYPVLTKKESQLVSCNMDAFIKKYLNRSPVFFTSGELQHYCESNSFKGYVVGSDQVWRPRYCPSVNDYFLQFTDNSDVKRIAYATSFGVDEWEYTDDETKMCQMLIKKFDAVGVREDTGVVCCEKYLNFKSTHVLDPTMLLAAEDYQKIALDDNIMPSHGKLFCYVLDDNEDKRKIISSASLSINLQKYSCMPQAAYRGKVEANLDKVTYPAPAQWIRCFMDAEMVITDSFHGTAFSILFNKPFWVIGNARRGNTRMESLLRMFNIEDRLIGTKESASVNWDEPIDWNDVNTRLNIWRRKSLSFLSDSLK